MSFPSPIIAAFPSYSVPAGNSASLPVNSSVNQVLSLLSTLIPEM